MGLKLGNLSSVIRGILLSLLLPPDKNWEVDLWPFQFPHLAINTLRNHPFYKWAYCQEEIAIQSI